MIHSALFFYALRKQNSKKKKSIRIEFHLLVSTFFNIERLSSIDVLITFHHDWLRFY